MAQLNYKILPTRRKASGKLDIYTSLTFRRKVRYISTEFEIDDESQFENGKVCYCRDASIMNKRKSPFFHSDVKLKRKTNLCTNLFLSITTL